MAAINPRDKQRQRALDEALQSRMSSRFEKKLRADLSKTMKEVASVYEKNGVSEIAKVIKKNEPALRSTLTADYRLVANYFGKRLLDEAKSFAGPAVTKGGLGEMLQLSIADFIGTWVARRVQQINKTTDHQIRQVIRSGLEDGLGVDKIATQLRTLSTPLSAVRAHVIARTETHTAANFGAQQAAELTGLDMKREWVSAQDDRTRDTPEADHLDADGQTVGMNEPFTVSGEQMMFPGDPSGSAANVINCRCAVVFIYD